MLPVHCSRWEGRAVVRLKAEGSVSGMGGMSSTPVAAVLNIGLGSSGWGCFCGGLGQWARQDKAVLAGQRSGAGEPALLAGLCPPRGRERGRASAGCGAQQGAARRVGSCTLSVTGF